MCGPWMPGTEEVLFKCLLLFLGWLTRGETIESKKETNVGNKAEEETLQQAGQGIGRSRGVSGETLCSGA